MHTNCLSGRSSGSLDSCKQKICNSDVNTASFAPGVNHCHARNCPNGLNINIADAYHALYMIPDFQI